MKTLYDTLNEAHLPPLDQLTQLQKQQLQLVFGEYLFEAARLKTFGDTFADYAKAFDEAQVGLHNVSAEKRHQHVALMQEMSVLLPVPQGSRPQVFFRCVAKGELYKKAAFLDKVYAKIYE